MAKPQRPFAIDELPENLRKDVAKALRRATRYVDGIELLSAHQDQESEVLLALAFFVFEDACSVMVDQVVPAGKRALELLDQAAQQGAAEDKVKRYQARIKRVLKREEKREAQVLALMERDHNDLSLDEVTDLAYTLSDKPGLKHKALAAKLWGVAENLANKEAPTKSGYFRCRLGISLWDSGQTAAAQPYLDEMMDRQIPCGDLVRSFSLLAANRIIQESLETDDPASIARVFRELTRRVEDFPVAKTVRKRLLSAAKRHGAALDAVKDAIS